MSGCPIWNTPASVENGGDGVRVESPRTDGAYRISRTAMTTMNALSLAEKAKLTTWIVDQRRFGEAVPHVKTEVIERMKTMRRMRLKDRKDRYFSVLAQQEPTPSFHFDIAGPVSAYKDRLCAWTECLDHRDLVQLTNMLAEEGLLRKVSYDKIFLTSDGFERLEALEATNPESQQGFVAMWFDESMSEAADAIREAIRDAGYLPLLINDKEHNRDITDEIIAEIRRSRFVVADFTCGTAKHNGKEEGVPRGGVYFEAGFAMGLGIEVIWACRSDCMNFVHFDTRQHAHVVWATPAELREKLARRIGAVMGYGATARVRPDAAGARG